MVVVPDTHSGILKSAPPIFLQSSSMTSVDNIVKKKLKIKLVSKRIEADPKAESCGVGQLVLVNNDYYHSIPLTGSKKSEINTSHKLMSASDGQILHAADNLKLKSSMMGSLKRGLLGAGDGQKEKRRKMDRSVTQQCSSILKQLISHKAGWVFKEPVDPVKLEIPDYFSIISKPMDLGTIGSKLANNRYSSVEEFAADVRLTFSNAMVYNPPDNFVHVVAKELNDIFNLKWKNLEAKWNQVVGNVTQGHTSTRSLNNAINTGQSGQETSHLRVSFVSKRIMPAGEKQKLRKILLEVSREKMPQCLQSFLKKIGFNFRKEEIIKDVDALDDSTLWELKRIISSVDARAAKAMPAKRTECGGQESIGNVIGKGTPNGSSTSGSGDVNQPLNTSSSYCSSCGNVTCQCSLKSDYAPATSSDLSSERSLGQDHVDASGMDCEAKSLLASQMSKSDPDSDGAVSALDEEPTCSSRKTSTLATTSASREVWSALIDIPLSPKKALRAAMLKTRFADTILKAKQKTLLDHGDKADPMRMQQEKERLEKQQREEKARIEAQISEAEAASQLRAEAEMKLQREQEREAARVALQKMEKTVEIDDNLDSLRDLEMLSGCSLSDHLCSHEMGPHVVFGPADGVRCCNLLERLGLFRKDDMGDEDEDEILNADGEEGEIF